jgi:hypothetical protein
MPPPDELFLKRLHAAKAKLVEALKLSAELRLDPRRERIAAELCGQIKAMAYHLSKVIHEDV